MQRHQCHDAALVVGVGQLVGVGDQRHLLEEVTERPIGARLLELACDRDELLKVLHATLVLRVVGSLQLSDVARLVEHSLEDVGR